jgi:hypothetical protein
MCAHEFLLAELPVVEFDIGSNYATAVWAREQQIHVDLGRSNDN